MSAAALSEGGDIIIGSPRGSGGNVDGAASARTHRLDSPYASRTLSSLHLEKRGKLHHVFDEGNLGREISYSVEGRDHRDVNPAFAVHLCHCQLLSLPKVQRTHLLTQEEVHRQVLHTEVVLNLAAVLSPVSKGEEEWLTWPST